MLSIFVQRNGIPSCVLFRGMVWNGIPRICIYFGSTKRNSELCSLPQKGSEQDYGSLLLFLFHGTEFGVFFSSMEGFGTEFRDFLFRGTTGIPSEITICSVYSVFRGIIFLSEIPNPTPAAWMDDRGGGGGGRFFTMMGGPYQLPGCRCKEEPLQYCFLILQMLF